MSLVLAGVRPEEITEWQAGPVAPAAAVSFAASADAQAQTVERVDRAGPPAGGARIRTRSS